MEQKQNTLPNQTSSLVPWWYSKTAQSGFTLLEMLFVVGIMAMFYLLMVTNFSTWRAPQYLKNAQVELVTTIQKIHSFSLSGRQIAGNVAKYYVIRFNTAVPRSYVIQGIATDSSNFDHIYDAGNGPLHHPNIEQINFPLTVLLSGISLNQGGSVSTPTCVQLVFALPYGKTYMTNCASNDIYTIYQVPSALGSAANSTLTLTLSRGGSTDTRTVTVYGVSGRVEASP